MFWLKFWSMFGFMFLANFVWPICWAFFRPFQPIPSRPWCPPTSQGPRAQGARAQDQGPNAQSPGARAQGGEQLWVVVQCLHCASSLFVLMVEPCATVLPLRECAIESINKRPRSDGVDDGPRSKKEKQEEEEVDYLLQLLMRDDKEWGNYETMRPLAQDRELQMTTRVESVYGEPQSKLEDDSDEHLQLFLDRELSKLQGSQPWVQESNLLVHEAMARFHSRHILSVRWDESASHDARTNLVRRAWRM